MQINNFSSLQINFSNSQSSGPGAKPPSHEDAVSQLGASLSEEQQEEILSGIEVMKNDGATNEDIKAYVDSSLEAFGVDLSQVRGAANSQSSGPGAKPPSHEDAVSQLGASLSEEQQEEILSGIEVMKNDGATNEDIKAYVDSSLETFGVDLSQARGAFTNTIV